MTQQVAIAPSAQPRVDPLQDQITYAQVREFLRLSGTGEVFRQGWLAALEKNRSKGEPYWPESFWTDLRDAMLSADIVPLVLNLYQPYISGHMLQSVNEMLKTRTVSELAATPLGADFCKLQQQADLGHEAATMKLTQEIFMRVYEKDKAVIKAARAEYIEAHPGYKD